MLYVLLTFVLIGSSQVMADIESDVEKLMDESIVFAKQMLKKEGEFLPYGAAMKPDGEVVWVGAYDNDEHPPSQEVIDLLKQGFRQSAAKGDFKATAIIYDVRIKVNDKGEKSDAIAIAVDHKYNFSIIYFYTYEIDNDEIRYGEIRALKGAKDVFPE